MDHFVELTTEMSLLTLQLRLRQMTNEHYQRVTNQVRNPYMHMAQVLYGGTPYLNNYNSGWQHCLSTSWEESHDTL